MQTIESFYIERKKEFEQMVEWLEAHTVMRSLLGDKSYSTRYYEDDSFFAISYTEDDLTTFNIGISHKLKCTWNYDIMISSYDVEEKLSDAGINVEGHMIMNFDDLQELYKLLKILIGE